VRVCLHAGEVLVTADTVLGEPMEVVESVEHVAAADEVTFTEAVNLARNRAEATAEPCGTVTLPGREEQLQLYRCQRAAEGPPYGDRFTPSSGMSRVKRTLSPIGARVKERLSAGVSALRHNPRLLAALVGILALVGAGIAWTVHQNQPTVRAMALLDEGKKEDARKLLEAVPAEDQKSPDWQWARAAVFHAQGVHSREHLLLSRMDDDTRGKVEDRVLDGLAEDYARDESEAVAKLLGRFPRDRVVSHFEDLAEEPYSPKQWGALRYLEYAKATDDVDLVHAYISALDAKDCGIRAQAAVRLEALGDDDAVPALTRLAEQPREKKFLGSGNCGQDEAGKALQKLAPKRD
jgi:serine/threonine-protein kinase